MIERMQDSGHLIEALAGKPQLKVRRFATKSEEFAFERESKPFESPLMSLQTQGFGRYTCVVEFLKSIAFGEEI